MTNKSSKFKILAILLLSMGAAHAASAQEPIEDLIEVDGTSIDEPELEDYEIANRVPGFSPITDIVDIEGKSVTR